LTPNDEQLTTIKTSRTPASRGRDHPGIRGRNHLGTKGRLHRNRHTLSGRAPFGQLRDLVRKVQADCAVDLDTNSYSVPWRLIGESVQVVVMGGRVIVRHAGLVVADHALCLGRQQRIVDRGHFVGVAGFEGAVHAERIEIEPAVLLRPLAEYEAVVGGGW
jgi:hypothetical protein